MHFYCCWLASLYLWMASNYGPLPLCSYIVRILPTLAWKGLNRVFFAAFFYKIFSRARTWSWCGINQILTQPFYECTILRNKKELSQIIWWNWSWNDWKVHLRCLEWICTCSGSWYCQFGSFQVEQHSSQLKLSERRCEMVHIGKFTKYFMDMHYQCGRLFQMYNWWNTLGAFSAFL